MGVIPIGNIQNLLHRISVPNPKNTKLKQWQLLREIKIEQVAVGVKENSILKYYSVLADEATDYPLRGQIAPKK